jgi:hypothetical protein
MATVSKDDRDCYRIIVLRDHGTQLLALLTKGGLSLPSIEVPRSERVALNITHLLTSNYGCQGVCVFLPEIHDSSPGQMPCRWQIMECFHESGMRKVPAMWTRVSSLSGHHFANSLDYAVIRQSLEQLHKRRADRSRPFAGLGWFTELRGWIKDAIRPLGIELTGKFSQLNASPSFSLIRFETTGPALWFKAVGEPNEHEFPITLTLSRLFPRHLPAVVSARPEWRGWLMKDGGSPMGEIIPAIDTWKRVAADLANLQIDSIPYSQELISAGSRDLRMPSLLDQVDLFFELIDPLMRRQTKASPAPLSPRDLSFLRLSLKDSLQALDQFRFPETLGHSDFNPGNVLWANGTSLFIDWAEAHIGHPFFTFEYLMAHARDNPDIAPFEECIRTAYTQPWKYFLPAQDIKQALAVSPLTAVFAYAVAVNQSQSADRTLRAAPYLRSLARRMKREADRLVPGSVLCPQS